VLGRVAQVSRCSSSNSSSSPSSSPEDKENKADLEADLAVASALNRASKRQRKRNDLDDQRSRDAETQFTQGHAVWRGRSAESCSGV
jgi:hypothetical protein